MSDTKACKESCRREAALRVISELRTVMRVRLLPDSAKSLHLLEKLLEEVMGGLPGLYF